MKLLLDTHIFLWYFRSMREAFRASPHCPCTTETLSTECLSAKLFNIG